MRRVQNLCLQVVALLTLFALLPLAERPAYGYTDPGSGALIWQTLMAAFVGLSFYFRRILTWFRRRRKASSADES